jgi:hypothetical protein
LLFGAAVENTRYQLSGAASRGARITRPTVERLTPIFRAIPKKILAEFKPAMTKDGYLAFERGLFRTERYKPEAST